MKFATAVLASTILAGATPVLADPVELAMLQDRYFARQQLMSRNVSGAPGVPGSPVTPTPPPEPTYAWRQMSAQFVEQWICTNGSINVRATWDCWNNETGKSAGNASYCTEPAPSTTKTYSCREERRFSGFSAKKSYDTKIPVLRTNAIVSSTAPTDAEREARARNFCETTVVAHAWKYTCLASAVWRNASSTEYRYTVGMGITPSSTWDADPNATGMVKQSQTRIATIIVSNAAGCPYDTTGQTHPHDFLPRSTLHFYCADR